MTKLSRRQFLATTSAAGASALLASPALAQSKELVVGTWGGTFGDLLKANVDEALLVPQGYDVLQEISGPVPRRTKLITERMQRRGSMDAALLADFDMHAAARVGALETLDAGNVPNYDTILPFLKKKTSVPLIYSAHVIVYRKDLVKTPPTSVQALWDPAYKGKIGLSDFLYTSNMAYAAVANGGTVDNYANAEKGVEGWKALEAKLLPSTEAVGQALASGDIWLTIISAARGYSWQKSGIDLAWCVPEEGAFPAVYEAGVPKNARHPEAGLAYMNALLTPDAQVAFAEKMGYLPTVKSAKISPELEARIGFSEAEQNRLWTPDLDFIMENQAGLLDTWNRILKG
ncbi:extracellular solute-binding protein [Pseudooceanicola sp. CBS1P-1]|uniref:Extracellular solute-binding protein n=1 Tax=Pseudooceanicola albus TaxID=2692189 RepID=A0A6L7GBS1_9RHOB|nr:MULTISPECIES: extracellular solute-binding protein [Pseudooceanicola]MBT9386758.1 extracellular solute-binding protein [Pseudooceanicola endophyticus]MXN20978.1 extracellular solute-binding protein [Pseudooceanicola albus]